MDFFEINPTVDDESEFEDRASLSGLKGMRVWNACRSQGLSGPHEVGLHILLLVGEYFSLI